MLSRLIFCAILALLVPARVWSKNLDRVVVISPHRTSIQQELVPSFEKFYLETYKKRVEVDWLDQGGAAEALRYLIARFDKNPGSAKIDLLWGGGEQPALELKKLNLAQRYTLSNELKSEVPASVGPVPAYDKEEMWHAVNYSSFGIFYNKKLLKLLRVGEPKLWQDLADPRYFDMLSNADPRKSSSHLTIYTIFFQALGWEKGWDLMTRIAANTQKFELSSSAPVKAVVSGAAVAALSVDYFAMAKVGDLGSQNLGFQIPFSQTIVNADPITMLKGAPNPVAAGRFIDFLLRSDTQKVFVLPKGAKLGPKYSTLARLAVNKKAYDETKGLRVLELNPFDLKISSFVLDRELATKMQFVFSDLIGSVLIDAHKELKTAVRFLRDHKRMNEFDRLIFPIREDEIRKYADKWSNQSFRNQTINKWIEASRKRYKDIYSKAN